MARKNGKTRKKFKQSVILNKKKLKNSILSLLYDKPGQTINYKQVSSWLGVKDDEGRRLVNVALQEIGRAHV